jgi:hypothetical protein
MRLPAPAFLCLPFFVSGIWMFLEIDFLAALKPRNFFQLKPPLFMRDSFFLDCCLGGCTENWVYGQLVVQINALPYFVIECELFFPRIGAALRTEIKGAARTSKRIFGIEIFAALGAFDNSWGVHFIDQPVGHGFIGNFHSVYPIHFLCLFRLYLSVIRNTIFIFQNFSY